MVFPVFLFQLGGWQHVKMDVILPSNVHFFQFNSNSGEHLQFHSKSGEVKFMSNSGLNYCRPI
jgi:hypothetical protein